MRQKFFIRRDDPRNELVIREYAVLGREHKHANTAPDSQRFSLIGEQTYQRQTVTAAMEMGRRQLRNALRTPNMYPISSYAEKIADAVVGLYTAENPHTIELSFDDNALFVEEESVK